MTLKHLSPEAMWKAYLESKKDDSAKKVSDPSESPTADRENRGKAPYQAWHFCDNREDADALAQLVLAGIKRATAADLWSYEEEGEPLPKPGEHSVITDWEGRAVCIIETTGVTVVPFNEVSEEFAAREGEGDGSLEYWRRVHKEAFSRGLKELNSTAGKEYSFSEEMPVVCEEFTLVYPIGKEEEKPMKKPYVKQTVPFIVPTDDGKHIEEHFGAASTGQRDLSIARMIAPPGWSEPPQVPEFDEYTLIIRGKKQITVEGEKIILKAGESIKVEKGRQVRYSNPFSEETEYISVCLPAFTPEAVHRNEEE